MPSDAAQKSHLDDLTRESPPLYTANYDTQTSQRRSVIHTPVVHRPKPRQLFNKPTNYDDPDDPIETFSDEERDSRARQRNQSRGLRIRQRISADRVAENHLARPSRKRQRSASPRYLIRRGDKENRPLRDRQAGARSPPVMEQRVLLEQQKGQQRTGVWDEKVDGTFAGSQSRRSRSVHEAPFMVSIVRTKAHVPSQTDALSTPDARKRPKVKAPSHASPFQPGANTMASQPSGSGRVAPNQSSHPSPSMPLTRMSFPAGSHSSEHRGYPSPVQINASRQASIPVLDMRDKDWHRSTTSRLAVPQTAASQSSAKGKQPMRHQGQQEPYTVIDDDDDGQDELPVSPFAQMTPHHPSALAAGRASTHPGSANRLLKIPTEPHAGPSTIQGSSPTSSVASTRQRAWNDANGAERSPQPGQRAFFANAGPSMRRHDRQNEPSLAREEEEDDEGEISFVGERKSPERPEAELGGFSAASDDVQLLEISPGEKSSRRPAAPSPSAGIPSSALGARSLRIDVLKLWVNSHRIEGTLSLLLHTGKKSVRFGLSDHRAETQSPEFVLQGSNIKSIRMCRNQEHPLITFHADLRTNSFARAAFGQGCERDEKILQKRLAEEPVSDMNCFLPKGRKSVHFIDLCHQTFDSPETKIWPLKDNQCTEIDTTLSEPPSRSRGGLGLPRAGFRADNDSRGTAGESSRTAQGRGATKRQSIGASEPLPGSLRAQRHAATGETQARLDFAPRPKSPAGPDSTADQLDTETSKGTRESRRLKDKPPRHYDEGGENGEGSPAAAEPVLRARKHPPPADKDLLLFPWPLTGRAEVNVTAGDRYRVVDDDFLNDTMIEFGIRHVIDQQPEAPKAVEEVARPPVWTTPAKIVVGDWTTYRNEISMLSSFFLEKLGKRKLPASVDEPWAGYNAVKRWTRNKNMFDKKMIIVPVNENFHWYLAVIINPRGVLRDPAGAKEAEPAAEDPSTKPSIVNPEKASDAVTNPSRGASPLTPEPSPLGGFLQQRQLSKPSSPRGSEQDVEDVVSAGDGDAQIAEADHSDPMNLTDATHDIGLDGNEARPGALNDKMRALSVTASPSLAATIPSSPPAPEFEGYQKILAIQESDLRSLTQPTTVAEDPAEATKSEDAPAATASKPDGSKGRTAPGIPVEGVEDCLIFTLDSLGGAHKDVGTCLAKWLLFEARDKLPDYKGGLTEAVYKEVKVPQQTNMSDCGLYLIHYVQQLIQRPKEIFKFIERPRPYAGRADHAAYMDETRKTWRNAETGSLRDHWAATIDSLASEYQRQQNGGKEEKRESPPKSDDCVDVPVPEPIAPVADPVTATETSVEEIVQAEGHVQAEASSAVPIDLLETGQTSSEEEEEHIEVRDDRPDTPPLAGMPIDVELVQGSVPARSSSESLEGELSIDMSAASDGPDMIDVSMSPEDTKDSQRPSQSGKHPVRSLKDRMDKRQPSSAQPPAAGSSNDKSAAMPSGRRARRPETGGQRMLSLAMSDANKVNGGGGISSRRLSRSPTKTETDSWAEITKSGRTTSPARASKLIEEADAEMMEPLEPDVGDRKEDQVLVPATQADAYSPNAGEIHRFDGSDHSESLSSAQSRRLFGDIKSRTWPESLLDSSDAASRDARMSSEDHVSAAHVPLASRFTSTPSLDLSGNPLNNQPQATLDIKGKGKAPAPQARPEESTLLAGLRAAASRTIPNASSRHTLTTTATGIHPYADESDDATEALATAPSPQSGPPRSPPAGSDAIYVDDGQDEAEAVGDDGVSNNVTARPGPRKQPTQYSRNQANGGGGRGRGGRTDPGVRRRVTSNASTVSAARISSSDDESDRNAHRGSPATLRQTTLPGSGTPKKGRKRRERAAGPVGPNPKKAKASGGKDGEKKRTGNSRFQAIDISIDSD